MANKIVSMDIQQGLAISLVNQKLYNVVDSLTAVNTTQRNDAINKMNAFINNVNAQTGKNLTIEQANYLINEAPKIITLIIADSLLFFFFYCF